MHRTARTLAVLALCSACGDKYEEEKAVCRQMIECVDALGAPTATYEATYGEDGTCWTDRDLAETCAPACEDVVSTLAETQTLPEECSGVTGPGSCDASVFPASGPLSAGDYAECSEYSGDVLISYFPRPTCSGGSWDLTVEARGVVVSADAFVYDPDTSQDQFTSMTITSGAPMWTGLSATLPASCSDFVAFAIATESASGPSDCLVIATDSFAYDGLVGAQPFLRDCEWAMAWTE